MNQCVSFVSCTGRGGQGVKLELAFAGEGTIKDLEGFNAEEDCLALQEVFDEPSDKSSQGKIIATVALRSSKQRQEMKAKYKDLFGKDLIEDLKKELGSKFDDAIVALFRHPDEFDAWYVHDAMAGVGTDENTLIEILCSRSNEEIKKIIEVYNGLYKKNLIKDLEDETSGAFKKLIFTLAQASRPVGLSSSLRIFNQRKAKRDAQALHNVEGQAATTVESIFHTVLTTRSVEHLKLVFKHYETISKKNIEEAIKKNLTGDVQKGYLAVAKYAKDRCGYFAQCIYEAMDDSPNDKSLLRLIISRAEIDLVQIKASFETKYEKTLDVYLDADYKKRSGDFKKILMDICYGNQHIDRE